MASNLTVFRRELHQIPEIGFELPKTLAYVQAVLRPLRCTLSYPLRGAICAYFDEKKPATIAFRADMDALPVTEKTQADYTSLHEGMMHACGHDGHTAMLLALAQYIDKAQALPNNTLLVFQPAEETTGGAKGICDTGIFENYHVKAVFGIHIWPELERGSLYTRPGGVMAQTGIVDLEIEGRSAHVARAEEGADALYAGVLFLHEAFEMAQKIEPLTEQRLLKFGCMQSGTVQNAISAHTFASGTLRAFDEKLHARMREKLQDIAQETQKKTGCKVQVSISEGYPPVCNDEKLYRAVMKHLVRQTPHMLGKASLTGEDFSFYQQHAPGIFFFLGTGENTPLHSDRFDFDESILESGFKLYQSLLSLSFT